MEDTGDDQATHIVSATCPAGKVVVGGGAEAYNSEWIYPDVVLSYPTATDTWTAYSAFEYGSGIETITVYAICVDEA